MPAYRSTLFSSLTAAATLTLASAQLPSTAHACGGLFCDNAAPVNQAAERILFADNGDGSVTAVIQIMYQGPSERFSWVLPVPGVPEVGISSNMAFDRLQQFSNPRYVLQVVDMCSEGDGDGDGDGDGFADAGDSTDAGTEEPTVVVLDAGTVGPFDYEVIRVVQPVEDPAQVAIDWLEDNGYDVGALGPDVLRPYLQDGLNLLAFRLSKNNDAGSIRPVVLTYDSALPNIPIRPTAVAANDDMGVMVWLAADGRAIPKNYKALELNEALINWFNPGPTYDAVVSAAADEASGHGFVTEMADTSTSFEDVIATDFERDDWNRFRRAHPVDAYELLVDANDRYGSWDGFLDAARRAVTLPAGRSFQQFLDCGFCDARADENGIVPAGFELDEDGFIDALDELVVQPLFSTQDLLVSRSHVTRLYTTMSASEMTVDPVFDYNTELSSVDNRHVATQTLYCDGSWKVDLPQGDIVYAATDSRTWPLAIGDQPAARRILQLSTRGSGAVVLDNSADISADLTARLPPGFGTTTDAGDGDGINRPEDSSEWPDATTRSGPIDDGCSCSTVGGGQHREGSRGLASASLLLGALGLLRSRRRAT